MKKSLTVNNMKIAYAMTNCKRDTWNGFKQMKHLGFITEEEWSKFESECKNWDVYYDPHRIIDIDGELVFNFESGSGKLEIVWDRI